MSKIYIATLRVYADEEIDDARIRQEIYDACGDVPFGFDITSVAEQP